MTKAKRKFGKILSGTFKKRLVLPIITTFIAIIFFFIFPEYRTMILSAFIGFLVGKSVIDITIVLYHTSEDARKAIRDYDELCEIYDEDKYGHLFLRFPKNAEKPLTKKDVNEEHMKSKKIFYKPLITNIHGSSPNLADDPDNFYKIPEMIIPYYSDLLSAHKASYTENAITYRLLDTPEVKNGQINIKTARTTYYDHLVMNRAIDFPIRNTFSVRKLYEFNNTLTSLKDSVLANQIGVNAIVLFSDNRTIYPKRSLTSTVAKNKYTASLAIRLDSKDKKKKLTNKDIREDFKDKMKKRLYFTEEELKKEFSIILLGIGRNMCEGGKPQFYYLVKFKNYDSSNYIKRLRTIEKEKRKRRNSQIDFDKKLVVSDFDSLALKNSSKFMFNSYAYDQKKDQVFAKDVLKGKFENSYLYNLWHYFEVYEPHRIADKRPMNKD